jgi:hypothetical protein
MRTVTETLDACAKCCDNSAAMLFLCDQDKPNLAQYNQKQAALLRECAEMLRELIGSEIRRADR